MKTLYLVRHGQAESFSPTGQDAGRHLTQTGRSQVEAMGALLHQRSVLPSVIVCSPFTRAIETADILARQMHYTAAIDRDRRLVPSAAIQELQAIITEFREVEELMLVGHEPWMSSAAGVLVAGTQFHIAFQPGSVCCISIDRSYPVGGSLLWFLPPAIL